MNFQALLFQGTILSWLILRTLLPFDLAKPSRKHILPEELLEISALTDVDDHTVACVQDEMATIYLLDLRTGDIIQRIPFGSAGDMEGLTRVGQEYFALRSDGLMYRLALQAGAAVVLDTFRLQLPNRDLEGLGFDERRGLVLISPKDFLKGDAQQRDVRLVHAYDPVKKHLLPEPVLSISIADLTAQAERKGMPVPQRTTKEGRSVNALKLRLSSVAVDPRTDQYYLLSAVDRTLLVLDRQGELVALEQLDPALFPKPEGITFMSSGEMVISNEGKDGRPNVLVFDRR